MFIFPVFIFVIIYEILLPPINPGVHGPSGSSWGGGRYGRFVKFV